MSEVINKILNIKSKSAVFIYPILGIPKNAKFKPIASYMAMKSYNDNIGFNDSVFILKYKIEETVEFSLFQKRNIRENKKFLNEIRINNNTKAYIFDMKDIEEDFMNASNGKYSKLTEDTKKKIINHNKHNPSNIEFLKSYLYPDKYFKLYAKLLSARDEDIEEIEKLLSEVGELCSKPNIETETLDIKKESKLVIQI